MVRGDWTISASEEVYQNPWISVNHHSVITPGGTQGIYGEVHFKNLAIGIIPLDDQGYTWRVGQFRFPLNRYSWEIPEGGGPIHIDSLVSAQRELQEEVGLQADKWERLLELDLSNSVTNERSIVYVAEGLTHVSMEHEDTENLTIERIPFFELYQDVMNGLVRDSISVAAVLKLAIQRPGLLEI